MATKLRRTLYIGLGGTGFKTLLHTKKAFIETYGEVPPMIKFLAIDSDENQYKTYSLDSTQGIVKFDPSEATGISVHSAESIVKRNRQHLGWLPDKNLRAVSDLVNGCGMVRTNGRIAFALNYRKIREKIQRALNQVCNLTIMHNDNYELLSDGLEINIVYSIAGGTGSGNFIDTAYLVKDVLRELALSEKAKVVGYMVLPDVYDAQLNHGKERLKPNGCGSLVDLDYLMHFGNDNIHVNYITEEQNLVGTPFNTVMAISNRNLNGDVVNHSDFLSEMMSLGMVMTAGELASGMNSIMNNLEQDMHSGVYDIVQKQAILSGFGISKITFRASELFALFSTMAARELAAALLNPGSNANIDANTWIDANQIRENNGQDQVIDYLLPKNPRMPFNSVYNEANPMSDVETYRESPGVEVDIKDLNAKVDALKERISTSFHDKIRNLVDANGPVYAMEFIDQVKSQIEICNTEMENERQECLDAITARNSAIKTAIEEYKEAKGKFFGRKAAVQDTVETLSIQVNAAVLNNREVQRRNGAISFYTWFLQELSDTFEKLRDIESNIKNACQILRNSIAAQNSSLMSPRGMFEVDLTQPYVNQLTVSPDVVNINQFSLTLPKGMKISSFADITPDEIAKRMLSYTNTLSSGGQWEYMSAEDALARLPEEEIQRVISRAIALSSPMCPLDYRGHLQPELHNYYFIGVQEQSKTGLKGEIINLETFIPSHNSFEVDFASIGSRDKIIIYHLYGVFPTFALAGTQSYRRAHDNYIKNPTSYSCFIDEDLRIKMERDGFSVLPKEQVDNSMELWVKGIIYGLIKRDENGTFMYKDVTNDAMALRDYWTSLGTQYRDEAFKNFKRESDRLQPQFESHMTNRIKSEGQDAINGILADAKNNYLNNFSSNDLSVEELENPLYKGIKEQLLGELKYVKNDL